MFVGALHPDTPNEDGLLWFVEQVAPRLRALLPEPPTLDVVGECRSERIAALASADIRLLGPQADLRPCYDRARVFIAPVRFAGGVPVKVIEAAAQGIPVVASAILLRQLGWQDGLEIQGARDADAFAHAIARLLTDDALWRRQQAAAWARCEADYHPDDFARQVHRLLLGEPATNPLAAQLLEPRASVPFGFAALPDDPDAHHPDALLLPDAAALWDWLRTGFEALVTPLIDRIHAVTGLGRPAPAGAALPPHHCPAMTTPVLDLLQHQIAARHCPGALLLVERAGQVLARHAALFDARAPPSVR